MEQGKGKGTASLYGAGAGMAAMLKESASQKKQWAMDKANSFMETGTQGEAELQVQVQNGAMKEVLRM